MKVFRPFWSFDVRKTEVWLLDMAKKGYLLVELNRWTRCFFFRKSDSNNVTYRIGYDKMPGPSFATSLVDEGWNKVVHSGNWYALSIHPTKFSTPVPPSFRATFQIFRRRGTTSNL